MTTHFKDIARGKKLFEYSMEDDYRSETFTFFQDGKHVSIALETFIDEESTTTESRFYLPTMHTHFPSSLGKLVRVQYFDPSKKLRGTMEVPYNNVDKILRLYGEFAPEEDRDMVLSIPSSVLHDLDRLRYDLENSFLDETPFTEVYRILDAISQYASDHKLEVHCFGTGRRIHADQWRVE